MKTAELEGAKLDYWVARAVRGNAGALENFDLWQRECWDKGEDRFTTVWANYSNPWTWAGPIIERERIAIEPGAMDTGNWLADFVHPAREDGVQRTFTVGPTPLIAAMRAFVASKFGEEVPDA